MMTEEPRGQGELFDELSKLEDDGLKNRLRECIVNRQSFDLVRSCGDLDEGKLHQIRTILLEFLSEVEFDNSLGHNAMIELMLTIGRYFKGSEIVPVLTKLSFMFTRYLRQSNSTERTVRQEGIRPDMRKLSYKPVFLGSKRGPF